jgi:hypothetical protein
MVSSVADYLLFCEHSGGNQGTEVFVLVVLPSRCVNWGHGFLSGP